MKKKITVVLVLMILMLAIPAGASAKADGYMPVLDDRVVFGSTVTLESGEVLDGDIVIIGGVLRMEPESLVTGDVVAIGSSISVKGEISHNLVAIGGVLTLTDTAVVRGDLIAPGSVMKKDESAQVYGQLITSSRPIKIEGVEIPDVPEVPEVPEPPQVPQTESRTGFADRVEAVFTPVVNGLWFMFRLFAISAVAVVLALFVPAQAKRTSNVIISQPVLSGVLGLLTIMIAGPLMVLLSITVILIPVTLLLALALMFGLFFGWIAMGQEIGRRIGVSLGQDWSDAIQAGIGTFLLTFMVSGLNFIFWDVVGWMLGVLIASIGLGAVLMTRFGTRDYKPKSTYIPADTGSTAPIAAANSAEAKIDVSETESEIGTEEKKDVPKTPAKKAATKSKTTTRKTKPKTKTAAKKATAKSKTSRKKTAPKTKSSVKKTTTKSKTTRKKTSTRKTEEQKSESEE